MAAIRCCKDVLIVDASISHAFATNPHARARASASDGRIPRPSPHPHIAQLIRVRGLQGTRWLFFSILLPLTDHEPPSCCLYYHSRSFDPLVRRLRSKPHPQPASRPTAVPSVLLLDKYQRYGGHGSACARRLRLARGRSNAPPRRPLAGGPHPLDEDARTKDTQARHTGAASSDRAGDGALEHR